MKKVVLLFFIITLSWAGSVQAEILDLTDQNNFIYSDTERYHWWDIISPESNLRIKTNVNVDFDPFPWAGVNGEIIQEGFYFSDYSGFDVNFTLDEGSISFEKLVFRAGKNITLQLFDETNKMYEVALERSSSLIEIDLRAYQNITRFVFSAPSYSWVVLNMLEFSYNDPPSPPVPAPAGLLLMGTACCVLMKLKRKSHH